MPKAYVTIFCFVAVAACSATLGQEAALKLSIEAQPLDRALNAWADQTGYQVLIPVERVGRAVTTPRVKGMYTPEGALKVLLASADLKYQFVNARTVAVRAADPQTGIPANAVPVGSHDVSQGDRERPLALAQSRPRETEVVATESAAERTARTPKNREGIEEIIVTANRREERAQDIPMSLSALSADDVAKQGLVELDDYLRAVPGVSYLEMGVGRNAVVIRGTSVNPQSEGLSIGQTAGTYFGEVPLSALQQSAADLKLVDMERIEVLRGPQGTLYGAGALAGAIRNIPAPPDLQEFDGRVQAGYSITSEEGSDNNEVTGILNIPLSPGVLAFRALGYRFKDSGYITNVAGSDPAFVAQAARFGAQSLAVDQENVGNTEHVGGRAQLLWRPVDNFSATLLYGAQNLEQDGIPEDYPSRPIYQQARLQIADILGGGGELMSQGVHLSNLVLEYSFPWATLVSSSSYSTQAWQRSYDVGPFFGNIPAPQRQDIDTDGFNQELRLVSRLSGPIQFVAGLYYEDIESTNVVKTYFGGDPTLNPFSNLLLIDTFGKNEIRQKAVFGELSYTFAQKFTITGGARKFQYDRNSVSTSAGALLGIASSDLKSDENDESYKVNLAYHATEDAMIYALWSQGFRLGRPGAPTPSSCDQNGDGFIDGLSGVSRLAPNVDSDHLDNYELGAKLGLLSNRLTLNVTVYDIKWTGVPVTVVPPCGIGVVLNAGRATSRGTEIESAFLISDNLKINIGGSYLRAELDGDAPGIGLDGDRLPGSPKYQYNAGLQYSFNVAALPMFVRGDYAYLGGFYNNVQQTGIEAGDYGQLNLKWGATIRQFEVALFANNLTDVDDVSWVNASIRDGRQYRPRPRTVGVNATIRF